MINRRITKIMKAKNYMRTLSLLVYESLYHRRVEFLSSPTVWPTRTVQKYERLNKNGFCSQKITITQPLVLMYVRIRLLWLALMCSINGTGNTSLYKFKILSYSPYVILYTIIQTGGKVVSLTSSSIDGTISSFSSFPALQLNWFLFPPGMHRDLRNLQDLRRVFLQPPAALEVSQECVWRKLKRK